MTSEVAIIGAGPKAAAIAAKAHVLNAVRGSQIRITIFERYEIGANWLGDHGYTDGEARLCTPAERDLGFPYDAGLHDSAVATRMYSDFSWGAYLVAAPKTGGREGLSGWVNRGRLPPSHAEYAGYLRWAIERSGAKLEIGEVIGIERGPGGWIVRRRNGKTRRSSGGPFQGVVITGPGPAQSTVARANSNRIVDGVAFWSNPTGFLKLGANNDDPIIIIGAGGTAAAVAARLLRDGAKNELLIIGDQAALFTRSETFFESRIFSDEEVWERLDIKIRSDFTRRLNRGVVWSTVSEQLAKSGKLTFEPGRAEEILVAGPKGEDLAVAFRNRTGRHTVPASLVVDASGFDGWWFASLLPDDLRSEIENPDSRLQKDGREALIENMGSDLSLFDDRAGAIHAPVLSQAVGPGFSTLMVLGAMSDRVLSRYI